jgi:hypothetical protein
VDGGVDVSIHIFLTSALVEEEWSVLRPCLFTPRERATCTHWIGGWVDPRGSVDDMEKRKLMTISGLELRPLSRRARSQSLYWLRYVHFPKKIMRVVIITQLVVLVLVRKNARILVTKQGQIYLAIVLVAVCQGRSGSSTAASGASAGVINSALKTSKNKLN